MADDEVRIGNKQKAKKHVKWHTHGMRTTLSMATQQRLGTLHTIARRRSLGLGENYHDQVPSSNVAGGEMVRKLGYNHITRNSKWAKSTKVSHT